MEIEKNIPTPPGVQGTKKYPFDKMEVGDSIFIKGQTSVGKAANAARVYANGRQMKFSSRSVDGGVRIWRIE